MTQTLDQALTAAGVRNIKQRRSGCLVILGDEHDTPAANEERARVTLAILNQYPEHKTRARLGMMVQGSALAPEIVPAVYILNYCQPDPTATDELPAIEISPDGTTSGPTPGCDCPSCVEKRARTELQ
jgi:hypothetical protein